jgi:uncharacterized membrane protein YkvA (DUF1232 family)
MATSPSSLTTWQMLRLLWHLPNFVKLYWRLFNDRRVPLRAKFILIAAALYIVAPFDFLPDFVSPLLGRLDDLAILIIAARWFISLCPPDVVQERVKEISEERRT